MPGIWEKLEPQVDLLVAVPIVNKAQVHVRWALSFREMGLPPNTRLLTQEGMPVDVARNTLVQSAKDLGAKHILFLDDDVILPDSSWKRSVAIPSMLAYHLPIISGLYWSKRGYPAMWNAVVDELGGISGYTPIMTWAAGDPILRVDVVPMGFCLIDMRVFDAVPEPWFEWTMKNPNVYGGFSEDFDFCRKAAAAGFPLYVQPAIECRHESIEPLDVHGKIPMRTEVTKKGTPAALHA